MKFIVCPILMTLTTLASHADEPIEIGSRRELFVDDYLIEKMDGVELRLHHPVFREKVITYGDKPVEGNHSGYTTVFRDGDIFRMYFRGLRYEWEGDYHSRKLVHQHTCYAESQDGIHWTRPNLGLFDHDGSKHNNIVWKGVGVHNFTPFKDTHPDCPLESRYKAIGFGHDTNDPAFKSVPKILKRHGLYAFQSADGIHWSLMRKAPVITKGGFDSQNVAFFDSIRGQYVCYSRTVHAGVRAIQWCMSQDFLHWTTPKVITYDKGTPNEQLYTNAIQAYFRAPHILLGFPNRCRFDRQLDPARPKPGIADGVLMSSRDGRHFHRWGEGFIRPGPQPNHWWDRTNRAAWGMLVTKSDIPGAPDELSFYTNEGNRTAECGLRRSTLRIDGFVSACAPLSGGEVVTKPLTFAGDKLTINFATSAGGEIRVGIEDADGKPLPGFALDDCPAIFGDALGRKVTWKNGSDVSKLAGKPIRLRIKLKDADLYAFRFQSGNAS